MVVKAMTGLQEDEFQRARVGVLQGLHQRGLQALAAQRAAHGAQPDKADRVVALHKLRGMQRRRDALAQSLSLALRHGDVTAAAFRRGRLDALAEEEREALRHIGGAALRNFVEGARRSADDLHRGRKRIDELSPREFSEMLTLHVGRPASELLDAPGAPAPVGRALRRFHAGLAGLRRDGGREALAAFNELFAHELEGLVGQHGYDGSTVVAAQFGAPVPHPGSRHHLALMLRLQLRSPDGRRGEQHVPVMDDHGHLLVHPEASAASTVRNFHLGALFHHIGALESIYRAVNADPRCREKIVAGFMRGDEARAARMLDWMHLLGRDPAQWMPRRELADAPTEELEEDVAPGSGEAREPYLEGRLYLGHDGRKARYLGRGKWGAP